MVYNTEDWINEARVWVPTDTAVQYITNLVQFINKDFYETIDVF